MVVVVVMALLIIIKINKMCVYILCLVYISVCTSQIDNWRTILPERSTKPVTKQNKYNLFFSFCLRYSHINKNNFVISEKIYVCMRKNVNTTKC